MPEGTRSYRSKRREQAAAQTRQDILDAARHLFSTRGYARVTMTDVARSAGVAVKTLYGSVGTKTQILHALLTADLADSRAGETNDTLRLTRDLPSAVGHIAHVTRVDTERFARSIELLLSSAASDESAREVHDQVLTQYREALRGSARHLVALGAVAPHLTVEGVADRLWLCFGLSAWRTLVTECHWDYDAAERLLTRQALLLLRDPESA
ncbi:helix-turn-helix domain-containing protein [Streptomyces ziwulingensis]|uniref:HTH tetR-type domain-containing protein n=1 Tax=Streptomyces ziwulingensis TaxID=1045501 RepID=A0ABP9AV30_9ACTN